MKKIVYHAKTDHVPANYVLRMHYDFDDDNKPIVCTGYTRYKIYYCSGASLFFLLYMFIYFPFCKFESERKTYGH